MPPHRYVLLNLIRKLDQLFDGLRFRMIRVAGRTKPIQVKIATYRGFGRADCFFLQGRVLIRKSIRNKPFQTAWQQLVDSYHRLHTDEIPRARLRILLDGREFETDTDQEGYFTLYQTISPPLESSVDPWKSVKIELIETPWGPLASFASTKILIPPSGARFGVITDLDDTIIHTGVTSPLKWEVLYNTLFKSAARRKVYEEVAAFFRALKAGPESNGFNPIFYVSNSPRNIHDLVKKYLRLHKLPKGPLLLRDIGIPYKLHTRDYSHKKESILRILETFPELPFILVGDSGEKDPYLYHEIAERFPGRILAILIRDVQHLRRLRRLKPLLEKARTPAIELFETYQQAALLASAHGFLDLAYFHQLCVEGK